MSGEQPQLASQPVVFINYHNIDTTYAQRLYSDLRAANLNPWIDKENLLPGQNKKIATEKAIKGSKYFVALLSTRSINETGDIQVHLKMGLSIRDESPDSQIYFIPIRLDEFDISQTRLLDIEYVDLFPKWEEGLKRILRAMNVDQNQIELVINHQRTNSPFASSDVSPGFSQNPFKGEKQFFVGRQNYISQFIKDKLTVPGSIVSIVGPGGSGKSQLAFKAMHEYIKEDIFDLVIPIYFDEGLIPFDKFLLRIAEILGLKEDDFQVNTIIEQRKGIIRDFLKNKKHPLIYLDNFETVSLILNTEQTTESGDALTNARQITDFLNNVIPANNTSILVTSREKSNNLFGEHSIDLDGLNIEDSLKLFNTFVRPIFKDSKGEIKNQIVAVLKKTGGHPLSMEIIAKNIRGFHEVEDIIQNLGGLKGDPTQAEERFQTLQACFDYTIKRLDDKLQELLPKLTLFKSPFPISAAVEVFGVSENEILDLYERSLLKLIDSNKTYGKVQNPEYWLYNFHLAVRSYVEKIMGEKERSYRDLEIEYEERLSEYYYNLLMDTFNSIGKENHISSLFRFNIIYHGEENDFDRAIELTSNKKLKADIGMYLGLIEYQLGMLSKALEHHTRSMEIHNEMKNKYGMAVEYKNLGVVLRRMRRFDEALVYHEKSLQINQEELNNRAGMARDYRYIGIVLAMKGTFDEALVYHRKALEINERELNDRSQMAKDYANIGLVLTDMGRTDEALKYHERALRIDDKELNNRVRMAKDYKNVGIVLQKMGRLDDALVYHRKALEIHEKLNDRLGVARDHYNMNFAYTENKKKEAMSCLYIALEELEEFKKDTNYHHPLLDDVNNRIAYLEAGSS